MGQYPSASLSYGMDIGHDLPAEPEDGCDHEELHWLTWALWEDSYEWETASAAYLRFQGVKGVQLSMYGRDDNPRWALVTKTISCHGWGDLTVVSTEDLAVTDDATRLLRAWALLFPDKEPGPLAWRLSASFG